MDLEKKAKDQLGWSPKHIARASQTSIVKALKTPIHQKEKVIELDACSLLLPPHTPIVPPKNFKSPAVAEQMPMDLVKSFETLQTKCTKKQEFRNANLFNLQKGGDLPHLDRAIDRDLKEMKKINSEMGDLLEELTTMVGTKRHLMEILDADDASLSQIKLHTELLTDQIDILKRTFQGKM